MVILIGKMRERLVDLISFEHTSALLMSIGEVSLNLFREVGDPGQWEVLLTHAHAALFTARKMLLEEAPETFSCVQVAHQLGLALMEVASWTGDLEPGEKGVRLLGEAAQHPGITLLPRSVRNSFEEDWEKAEQELVFLKEEPRDEVDLALSARLRAETFGPAEAEGFRVWLMKV